MTGQPWGFATCLLRSCCKACPWKLPPPYAGIHVGLFTKVQMFPPHIWAGIWCTQSTRQHIKWHPVLINTYMHLFPFHCPGSFVHMVVRSLSIQAEAIRELILSSWHESVCLFSEYACFFSPCSSSVAMQMEAGNHLNLHPLGSLKSQLKTRTQLVMSWFCMALYNDVEDKRQSSFSLRGNLHPNWGLSYFCMTASYNLSVELLLSCITMQRREPNCSWKTITGRMFFRNFSLCPFFCKHQNQIQGWRDLSSPYSYTLCLRAIAVLQIATGRLQCSLACKIWWPAGWKWPNKQNLNTGLWWAPWSPGEGKTTLWLPSDIFQPPSRGVMGARHPAWPAALAPI